MKSTTELLRSIDGLTREHLSFLVRRGSITPIGRGPGRGRPFVFSDDDATVIALVVQRRALGHTWDSAVAFARDQVRQPALFQESGR